MIEPWNQKYKYLFMDSNSIIYDCVRLLSSTLGDQSSEITDEQVIESVKCKIKEYIDMIKPSELLFIAFDGVAPLPKMQQQRNRRYKTYILSKLLDKKDNSWDTCKITPGTDFMKKLSAGLKEEYNQTNAGKYGVKELILSCSDERGEGEHKIFEKMRNSDFTKEEILIYGLDSDLFMLSLLNEKEAKNIKIFREAPEFMGSLLARCRKHTNKPGYGKTESGRKRPISEGSEMRSIGAPTQSKEIADFYSIDINELKKGIIIEMCPEFYLSDKQTHRKKRGEITGDFIDISINDEQMHKHKEVLSDYVYLCFLLGNDYLPGVISLNIRNEGIEEIKEKYREDENGERIIREGEINKKKLIRIIKRLSKGEEKRLVEEERKRERMEECVLRKELELEDVAIKYRVEEKYINVGEEGWEERYRRIQRCENKEEEIKKYMKMLEWVYKYYKGELKKEENKGEELKGALLLKDISEYKEEKEEEKEKEEYKEEYKEYSEEEQLLYIMPKDCEYRIKMLHKRYLWESTIIIE